MAGRYRARLDSRGRITLPRAVCEALGVDGPSSIEFEIRDGDVVLRKASSFFDWFGAITPRNRPEDWAQVRRETEEWVARRAMERGGIILPD